MVQTGDISSVGYTAASVGSSVTEFLISELPPFTNFTIHVQAVVMPSGGGADLLGDIDVEIVARTQSTTDTPPTPTVPPVGSPTIRTVPYFIGDPRDINTGRVM
jgi:hypothetical protein